MYRYKKMIMFKVSLGDQVVYGADSKAEPVDDEYELFSYLIRTYIRFLKKQKMIYNNCIDQPYKKWMDYICDPNVNIELVHDKSEIVKPENVKYNPEHLQKAHHNLCVCYDLLTKNRNKKFLNKYKLEKGQLPYEVNREALNQKHECACGGKYTTKNKAAHEKTSRHQLYLAGVGA